MDAVTDPHATPVISRGPASSDWTSAWLAEASRAMDTVTEQHATPVVPRGHGPCPRYASW
ncbi:MAG: hypothetical protein MJA29_00175 [Candidatus Omnitrophica bacterium]|nr:hypothetical protein [Candidatus Omnitrophota bacterium]